MSILSKLSKMVAARMPRVRGFGSSFYFGHPFLDAWFAWFPLNQIQYDGAAVGEIYNVASRIDERKSASWIVEWTKEAERVSAYADSLRSTGHAFTAEEGGDQHCQVGRIDLATNEILDWLGSLDKIEEGGSSHVVRTP